MGNYSLLGTAAFWYLRSLPNVIHSTRSKQRRLRSLIAILHPTRSELTLKLVWVNTTQENNQVEVYFGH